MADAFGVSVDYLIGHHEAKDTKYEEVSRRTGLPEEAIKVLIATADIRQSGVNFIGKLLLDKDRVILLENLASMAVNVPEEDKSEIDAKYVIEAGVLTQIKIAPASFFITHLLNELANFAHRMVKKMQ